MAQAEPVPTPRRVSLWSVGCLVVATGVLLPAGFFVGWANVIILEVTLLLLVAPMVITEYGFKRVSAHRRLLATTVGALLVSGWGWIFSGPLDYWFSAIGWGNRSFDGAVWRAAPADEGDPDPEHNPRGAMLRSLLREHCLMGMDKAQVAGLLGQPWPTGSRYRAPGDSREIWDYYVGHYSGFKMTRIS